MARARGTGNQELTAGHALEEDLSVVQLRVREAGRGGKKEAEDGFERFNLSDGR